MMEERHATDVPDHRTTRVVEREETMGTIEAPIGIVVLATVMAPTATTITTIVSNSERVIFTSQAGHHHQGVAPATSTAQEIGALNGTMVGGGVARGPPVVEVEE